MNNEKNYKLTVSKTEVNTDQYILEPIKSEIYNWVEVLKIEVDELTNREVSITDLNSWSTSFYWDFMSIDARNISEEMIEEFIRMRVDILKEQVERVKDTSNDKCTILVVWIKK